MMIRNLTLLTGETIFLGNTKGPVSGMCPTCGARMYAATSPLGTRFAKLYPGEKHTDPRCKRIDILKCTPDISKTDFESLVPNLLRESYPHSSTHDTQPSAPAKPSATELSSIRSLSAVQDSGVLHLSPLHRLRDELIVAKYFARPSWLDCIQKQAIPMTGNKIIECFYGAVVEETKSIYFNMTWSVVGEGKYHAHFQLRGTDKIFEEFVSKRCIYVKNGYGRTKLKLKTSSHMLIAGTWDRITCNPLLCSNCKELGCETCLGLFSSPLTNLSQCYSMRQGGDKDE